MRIVLNKNLPACFQVVMIKHYRDVVENCHEIFFRLETVLCFATTHTRKLCLREDGLLDFALRPRALGELIVLQHYLRSNQSLVSSVVNDDTSDFPYTGGRS